MRRAIWTVSFLIWSCGQSQTLSNPLHTPITSPTPIPGILLHDTTLTAGNLVNTEAQIPATLLSGPESELFLVQFSNPPKRAWLNTLAALDAQWLRPAVHQAALYRASPSAMPAIQQLPFVRFVAAYHPAYKMAAVPSLSGKYQFVVADVFDAQAVKSQIEQLGGTAVLHGEDQTIVLAENLSAGALPSVLATNVIEATADDSFGDIVTFQQAPRGQYRENSTRDFGANLVQSVGLLSGRDYSGEGLHVCITDNGIDPDLHSGYYYDPVVRSNTTSILNQLHGTNVTGVVISTDGGVSPQNPFPRGRGNLPRAQAIFTSAQTDPILGISRRQHTQALKAEGCVFETNSWGNSITSQYDLRAREIDLIVWRERFTIYQAMGNFGNNQRVAGAAWGKNVISVGGLFNQTTADFDDDKWNRAGAQRIASIGPAADGRIKPDLSAYFENIRTTGYGNTYANNFGGTSGATPTVAGNGGLVTLMWHNGDLGGKDYAALGFTPFESQPAPATIKALLINSAYAHPFQGINHFNTRMHQGWGYPDVARLYLNRQAMLVVNEDVPLQTGDRAIFPVTVSPRDRELRATLAYTDFPGNLFAPVARINDLTLGAVSPKGTVYWGNRGLQRSNESTEGGNPDHINNVENIWIPDAEPGQWHFIVWAEEINADTLRSTPELDATFALVISRDPRP